MQKRTRTLIDKKYMEFFVPTVLTAMANSIAMLVDSTIVNLTLGKDAFASVNLLSPIIQLYVAISILFGLSSATIIAKLKGEDGTETKHSNETFTIATIALTIISIFLIAIQLIFIDGISNLITTDEVLNPLFKSYYLPYIIGTPISLFMTSGVYIVRTEGRPKFASNIIIVSNVVNLVFDFVYILLFNTGIMGAALATITGNLVGVIMLLTHFRHPLSTIKFVPKKIENLGRTTKEIISYGISGSLGAVLITIKIFFLNTLVQQYGGATALVAFSVVSLCQILDSAFVAGACNTMAPIGSMLFGEKDFTGIRFVTEKALKILMISTNLIMVLMLIFAKTIVMVYGMTDAESVALGTTAVRICSLMFPTDALTFIGLYFLISVGQNKASTSISVINGVVFIIPLGIILSHAFGLLGVWASLPLAQLLSLIYVLVLALVLKRKHKIDFTPVELSAFSQNGADTRPEDIEDNLMACLEIVEKAPLEKGKKTKDTDVRICKDLTIIKNSGALLTEADFTDKNATFSKVLGFNQITLSN